MTVSLAALDTASFQAFLLNIVWPEGLLPALPPRWQEPGDPGAEAALPRQRLEALDGGLLLESRGDLQRLLKSPWQVLVWEAQVVGVVAGPAVYHDARLGLLQVEVPAETAVSGIHQQLPVFT